MIYTFDIYWAWGWCDLIGNWPRMELNSLSALWCFKCCCHLLVTLNEGQRWITSSTKEFHSGSVVHLIICEALIITANQFSSFHLVSFCWEVRGQSAEMLSKSVYISCVFLFNVHITKCMLIVSGEPQTSQSSWQVSCQHQHYEALNGRKAIFNTVNNSISI